MPDKSSIDTLARHGKSFYFAGYFLSRAQLEPMAELYSFCRHVDDCADELDPSSAQIEIQQIKHIITNPKLNHSLQDKINFLESCGIKRSYLADLVQGAEWDTHHTPILTEEQLDLYCYHVAGVVGLMMNPLMQVNNDAANRYAISLGKAMQLTNICRDILEDAKNERIYLPMDELRKLNLDLNHLQKNGPTPENLKIILQKYLNKADVYYQIGYQGLAFIPLRCRFVILLAGELYRHIGVKIKNQKYEVLKGRIYLNTFEKVIVLFKTITKIFQISFWSRRQT